MGLGVSQFPDTRDATPPSRFSGDGAVAAPEISRLHSLALFAFPKSGMRPSGSGPAQKLIVFVHE